MDIILTDAEDNDLTCIDLSGLTKKQTSKKLYYEKNKNKISSKRDIQVNCECGGTYVIQQKSFHFKRNIHKRFVENKK